MESWIEGRIKGREETKQPRKWVKEQQGKWCQYVISLWDWTKRGGVSLSLRVYHTYFVSAYLGNMCACVCVGRFTYTLYTWTVPHSSTDLHASLTCSSYLIDGKKQSLQQKCVRLCEGICLCAGVWKHACVWQACASLASRVSFITLYSLFRYRLTDFFIYPMMEIDFIPFPHAHTLPHTHTHTHSCSQTYT